MFLLILNALNAFALNVVIATSLKRMSAVAFVVIGVVKDGIIVITSATIHGDRISRQQKAGAFCDILVDIVKKNMVPKGFVSARYYQNIT